MKTKIIGLIMATCTTLLARETYETNWVQDSVLTDNKNRIAFSHIQIKTNYIPEFLFATNVYYANYTTNRISISPFKIQPSKWLPEECTNLVIDSSYSGTIQIGTNFYRPKNLHGDWVICSFVVETNTTSELQKFDLDMAEAKGRIEAYRDISLNRVQIGNGNTQTIVTNYTFKDCADFETGVEYGVIAYSELIKTNRNPTFLQIENQAKQNLIKIKNQLGIK